MNTSDYRVYVQFQPWDFQLRIFLYRPRVVDGVRSTIQVTRTGVEVEVKDGQELPEEVGLTLPADAWDALVEYAAGQSHLGERAKVLREWLESERGRVDSMLRAAEKGGK